MWRIAVELWGSDLMTEAIEGPSEDVYDTGEPFRPHRGPDYLDDQLTESEIDVICGVYHVLTSMWSVLAFAWSDITDRSATAQHTDQEKHQSWWPRPNSWSNCPFDTGFWTPMAESWFQSRLKKMRAGEAQPYHVQQWKSSLNSGRIALQVRRSVEIVSKDFIDNVLRPPQS